MLIDVVLRLELVERWNRPAHLVCCTGTRQQLHKLLHGSPQQGGIGEIWVVDQACRQLAVLLAVDIDSHQRGVISRLDVVKLPLNVLNLDSMKDYIILRQPDVGVEFDSRPCHAVDIVDPGCVDMQSRWAARMRCVAS